MVCEHEYMNMSPPPNYRACYGTECKGDSDVSQQCVLFNDKIKCSWIDQATKLIILAMKALCNFYNVAECNQHSQPELHMSTVD
jgi:hypothetical protein